jgi:hypothetical protein
VQVSRVCGAFGFETMSKAIYEATERAERSAVHRLHRRIGREP